jgi:hypothetical protein
MRHNFGEQLVWTILVYMMTHCYWKPGSWSCCTVQVVAVLPVLVLPSCQSTQVFRHHIDELSKTNLVQNEEKAKKSSSQHVTNCVEDIISYVLIEQWYPTT